MECMAPHILAFGRSRATRVVSVLYDVLSQLGATGVWLWADGPKTRGAVGALGALGVQFAAESPGLLH